MPTAPPEMGSQLVPLPWHLFYHFEWYSCTMRTTIDAAGRVVVPKAIRDRLQLAGGSELDIEERDGLIEIRPVADQLAVVQTEEGPVAVAPSAGPPLTDALVRQALERVRE